MTELLLKNSRKRGRPRKRWTQADTARELGISQQSVSNAIRAARAMEAIPGLAPFKTDVILSVLRKLKKPDDAVFKPDELPVLKVIAKFFEVQEVNNEAFNQLRTRNDYQL